MAEKCPLLVEGVVDKLKGTLRYKIKCTAEVGNRILSLASRGEHSYGMQVRPRYIAHDQERQIHRIETTEGIHSWCRRKTLQVSSGCCMPVVRKLARSQRTLSHPFIYRWIRRNLLFLILNSPCGSAKKALDVCYKWENGLSIWNDVMCPTLMKEKTIQDKDCSNVYPHCKTGDEEEEEDNKGFSDEWYSAKEYILFGISPQGTLEKIYSPTKETELDPVTCWKVLVYASKSVYCMSGNSGLVYAAIVTLPNKLTTT